MRTVATRRTLPLRIMVCRFGGHGAGTSQKARGGHHGAATVQHRVAAGAKAGRGTVGLAGCGHETSLFCMRNIFAVHAVVSKHFAAKSPDVGAALPSGSQNCRPGRRTENGRFALHNVEKQTFGDRWSIGCFSPTKIGDLKKWNLSICRQENNLLGPEPASFSPIEL